MIFEPVVRVQQKLQVCVPYKFGENRSSETVVLLRGCYLSSTPFICQESAWSTDAAEGGGGREEEASEISLVKFIKTRRNPIIGFQAIYLALLAGLLSSQSEQTCFGHN